MSHTSCWKRFGQRLLDRDGGHCHWCGTLLDTETERFDQDQSKLPDYYGENEDGGGMAWMATVDHLVPRSKGGKDRMENFVLACHCCNARRGADRASFKPLVPSLVANGYR